MSATRSRISKLLLRAAVRISPHPVKAVLTAILQAFSGLLCEINRGRTGGVIIAGWSTTESGKAFAAEQERACLQRAAEVRAALKEPT